MRQHTHIDSSGVFECPVEGQCTLAPAGLVFDLLLMGCKSAISVLRDSSRNIDYMVVADLRRAVKMAEGKQSHCAPTGEKERP